VIEDSMALVLTRLAAKNGARELALGLSRRAIRASANAIRAIHRHEFDEAERLMGDARQAVTDAVAALNDHPDVLYAGFVGDAQKEMIEAIATLAIVRDRTMRLPGDLLVDDAAYLNGLAETVGELRRHVLDLLRRDEVDQCESLLEAMDRIYGLLMTVDYPDAITGGLRRSVDAARAILERTRGDVTLAMRQRQLEARLDSLREHLR
jgi:translin